MLRRESLSTTPIAGTPHLYNKLINTTSVLGSWEWLSQFTTAKYCRDRNLPRRCLVNLLLLDTKETKTELGGA
jgi:hypothetical protein